MSTLFARAIIVGQATMSFPSALGPPISPGSDETPVVSDTDFVEDCFNALSKSHAATPLIIGRTVLTHNAKWGHIWRADFTIEGVERIERFVNRVVCWRTQNDKDEVLNVAIAIGQQVRRF